MSKKPPKPRYRPTLVVQHGQPERDEETGETVLRFAPAKGYGVGRSIGLVTVDRFQEGESSYCTIRSRWPEKEHPPTPADRLFDILQVVGCTPIRNAYCVALEDLENHEEHSGGWDPVSTDDCPWCEDAREVIRLVDLAVSNIEASLKTGNARNVAMAGLDLFGAGVCAGRLDVWPREAKVTHALNQDAGRKESTRERVRGMVEKCLKNNPDAGRQEIYGFCADVQNFADEDPDIKHATTRRTILKYAKDLLPDSRANQAKKSKK